MLRSSLLATSIVLLISGLSACGGDSSEGSGGAGGGGNASGSSGSSGSGGSSGSTGGSSGSGGTTGESFSIEVGPINVSPGDENTQCIVKRLGNPGPIKVNRIHNVISSSSHHMIVYRTNATEEQTTPFNCTPFLDTLDPAKGAPLVVTQKYDDLLPLPEGVAFSLDPNQMIRIELHYINTTGSPVDVSATASFETIPESEFQHEADFLFVGNVDISLPPQSAVTVGPTWFPIPSEFDGSKVFAITGHTHRFGTNVTVSTAPAESGPDTSVYDVAGWKWDEPETVQHSPPFELGANSGFRFTCEYQNTSNQNIGFGESANQEMCFFWAYYYPSKGARVCFHTDQVGTFNVCCPGNALCSQLF
jgi:hypothetical protein